MLRPAGRRVAEPPYREGRVRIGFNPGGHLSVSYSGAGLPTIEYQSDSAVDRTESERVAEQFRALQLRLLASPQSRTRALQEQELLGRQIGGWLFQTDTALERLQQAVGADSLRLRLIFEGVEADRRLLASVPWELSIARRDDYIAIQPGLSVVRDVEKTDVTPRIQPHPAPLNIGLLECPQLTSPQHRSVAQSIRELVRGHGNGNLREIGNLPLATASWEEDWPPDDILVVVAHGEVAPPGIWFDGSHVPVADAAEALADLSAPLTLLLICDSASTPLPSDAGLATRMTARGRPAVLGFQAPIGALNNRKMPVSILKHILDGSSIDAAVREARKEVIAGVLPQPGAPVLFLGTEQDQTALLEPLDGRRRGFQIVVLAILILSVAVGMLLIRPRTQQTSSLVPSRMTSGFNVAVVDIGGGQGAGWALATSISQELSDDQNELPISIESMGPDEIRSSSDLSDIQRLANDVNATAVVTIDVSSDGRDVTRRVWLRSLETAPELGGNYDLGSIVARADVAVNEPARSTVTRTIVGEILALGEIWSAIVLFEAGDYSLASDALDELIDDRDETIPGSLVPLIYLYRGNAALRADQQNPESAADWFRRGLELDPESARLQFGAAEAFYQANIGDCDEETSAGVLERARRYYEAVDTSPGPAILVNKVDGGVARTLTCSYFAHGDLFDAQEAIMVFDRIEDIWQRGQDPGLRELAAEATGQSAYLAYLTGGESPANTIEQLHRAGELSIDPARQATWLQLMATVYLEAENCEDAMIALAEAIELTRDDQDMAEGLSRRAESVASNCER